MLFHPHQNALVTYIRHLICGINSIVASISFSWSKLELKSNVWSFFFHSIRYFYKPLNGSPTSSVLRRIFSAIVCFTIIAFWHGLHDSIIVWVTMNILLTYCDRIVAIVFKSNDAFRMKALIGSPLLALAYISNIFFLSNYEIGWLFISKIILCFPWPLLTVLFIFYCGCFICDQLNCKMAK